MGALTESIADFLLFPSLGSADSGGFLAQPATVDGISTGPGTVGKILCQQNGGCKSSLALYQATVYRDPPLHLFDLEAICNAHQNSYDLSFHEVFRL